MKIRVKTFAQIKDILGANSSLEYPDGTSMKELLKSLRQKAGESENQLFSKEGELHSHLVLMMNGTRIYGEDVESIILSEGDEIALFSPVSGG
jgi:molybdopterin synthase sulfur carrier subunit